MPRSRTTSPTPLSPDISNSFVPGLTLTLSSPPESPQHRNVMENSSSSSPAAREHVHKKHKYMPPRIGTSFQAQIEPFDSELAKSTIQLRQEGIQNGLGGYHSYSNNDGNTTNVMSGEYGVNGGLFASTTNTTNDNNSGYASSNVGRRKKAGRPPKSGKGNGKVANLFQNNQPIYFNPNIPPPMGGLCIHRPYTPPPSNATNHTQSATNSNVNNNNIDQFLAFTRNILLQTTTTREDIQAMGQYNGGSKNESHLYNRIDSLYNHIDKKKGFDNGNMKYNTISSGCKSSSKGTGDSSSNSNGIKVPKKRGRKRKNADVSEVSGNEVSTNNSSGSTNTDIQSDVMKSNNEDNSTSTPVLNMSDANCSANDNSNNIYINDSDRAPYTALGLENDEQFLEYLQTRHNGSVNRAQFHLLSDLSRGRAIKTRRYHKKLKKDDEMNIPLSSVLAPLSDSWRRRYERLRSASTALGDYRDLSKVSNMVSIYPYFDKSKIKVNGNAYIFPWNVDMNKNSCNGQVCENDKSMEEVKIPSCTISDNIKSEENNSINDEKLETDEQFSSMWTSILENGQNIIASMNKSENTSSQGFAKMPALRSLLILLGKAYSLPQPEDVFGRRDSISKQLSQCLNSILDQIDLSRGVMATLSDSIFDKDNSGIDLNKLRKTLDASRAKCTVYIDEINILQEMLEEALEWESQIGQSSSSELEDDNSVSEDLNLPTQSLASAEELLLGGRNLSLRPNSLVILDDRIQRAYDLRNRIREWSSMNVSNDKESVKYVSSMIKEANQINLGFPELSVLSKVHRDAEEWVDRASVALRSKIPFSELESLVEMGQKLPLGLTATLEKLTERYESACEWIDQLKEEIPCPTDNQDDSCTVLDGNTRAKWLGKMLRYIENDDDKERINVVIDLADEGTRLPVDINVLQLLQTAIDSRNWSIKAKKWLPRSGEQYKRGKIEELEDHLDEAGVIINNAKMLTDGKCVWELDFKADISEIVLKAEKWFEKYEDYYEFDNRRSQGRPTIAFALLETIVNEANSIPANLGSSLSKVNRMHSDAKSWIDEHEALLKNCGIQWNKTNTNESPLHAQKQNIFIDDVNKAIDVARNDLSFNLEEVEKLKALASQSQGWFDRALEFTAKRNKRSINAKKDYANKHTFQEVMSLIDNADTIPMDTSKDLERLQVLLSDVKAWRLRAQIALREIGHSFSSLREERNEYYGNPMNFLQPVDSMDSTDSKMETIAPPSESDLGPMSSNGDVVMCKLVSNLVDSTEEITVRSTEEKITRKLEIVSQWCKKVALIISSHTEIYVDKRWKNDLDILISEGENLTIWNELDSELEVDTKDMELIDSLKSNVSSLIFDDIERLKILRIRRDKFYEWCEKVENAYVQGDKKISLEKLQKLANEGLVYPHNAETVKQVRNAATNATQWVKTVSDIIESGRKFSLSEAKTKLDAGSRWKFTCPEYTELRKSYNAAKVWSKKVQKSGLDEGSAQIYKIKELIKEHDSFLISMPDEKEALKQALCAYCICRRPYEGFMIGCDECDEWYHGPCIGVSQAQGNRIDKYLCVRCSVKKVYKNSCNALAIVVRKWCDPKDMAKARSQDAQKHQRKIREKKREIVKWKEELESNTLKLKELQAEYQSILVGKSNISQAVDDCETSTSEDALTQQITEVNGNVMKATTALEQCNRRLDELATVGRERKITQLKEDALKESFVYWTSLLRLKILSPDNAEIAERGRPIPSIKCKTGIQLLSIPMLEVLEVASKYGLDKFPDFNSVKNSFESISWCHFAFSVLMRKPSIEEVQALIDLSGLIKLPEVKCIGMLRSMISRTSPWQAKANKLLVPIAEETSPIDMSALNELQMELNSIPLTTPEEVILCHAIEDEGSRHCKCHGPRDEKTMENCPHCRSWYHFSCFSISDKQYSLTTCPTCSKSFQVKEKHITTSMADDDCSSHAPNPSKLWPPFGLADSAESREALGNIPSLSDKLKEPTMPLQGNLLTGLSGMAASGLQQPNMTAILSNINGTANQVSTASFKGAPSQPMPMSFAVNPFNVAGRPIASDTIASNGNYKFPSSFGGSIAVNAREAADKVKLTLGANEIPTAVDANALIDAKAAAEVAALAKSVLSSTEVMSGFINGFGDQFAKSNGDNVVVEPSDIISSQENKNDPLLEEKRPLLNSLNMKNSIASMAPISGTNVEALSSSNTVIGDSSVEVVKHLETEPSTSPSKPSVLLKKFG